MFIADMLRDQSNHLLQSIGDDVPPLHQGGSGSSGHYPRSEAMQQGRGHSDKCAGVIATIRYGAQHGVLVCNHPTLHHLRLGHINTQRLQIPSFKCFLDFNTCRRYEFCMLDAARPEQHSLYINLCVWKIYSFIQRRIDMKRVQKSEIGCKENLLTETSTFL